MQVGIGSISCDDETRKAIRREMGQSGLASRADVKKYVLEAIDHAFANAGVPAATNDDPTDEEATTFTADAVEAGTPPTAPPAAGAPAEPPSAGTSVGYTATT